MDPYLKRTLLMRATQTDAMKAAKARLDARTAAIAAEKAEDRRIARLTFDELIDEVVVLVPELKNFA